MSADGATEGELRHRRRTGRPEAVEGWADLRRCVRSRWGRAGARIVDDAYLLAHQAHQGRTRPGGGPSLAHSVAVARLVLGWGQPLAVVSAALLADLPTLAADLAPVQAALGDEVAALVALAHRLSTADLDGREPIAPGLREAAVIRVADRLQGARTWEHLPTTRAMMRAGEILLIVAPVADRLGLRDAGDELLARANARLTVGPPPLLEPVHRRPADSPVVQDGPPDDGAADGTAAATGRLAGPRRSTKSDSTAASPRGSWPGPC